MFLCENVELSSVMLQDDNSDLTYSDALNFSKEFCPHITPRSLMFILCSNTMGSVLGYISALSNKTIPVLISSSIDKDLFKKLYVLYTPAYIFADDNNLERLDLLKDDISFKAFSYSLIKTGNPSFKVDDELALLMSTSGSTGSPKLVRLSYKNLIANASSIKEFLNLSEDERAITSLPMNYSYGLSVINSHLLAGARIVLTDSSYIQKDFWELFRKTECTSFTGVPFTYEILKKLRFSRMDLPSLRYMTQAGGRLSKDLHQEFAKILKDKNLKFFVMYGSTEATARMSYLPYEESLSKIGSIGIAIPGGKFYLKDDDGSYICSPNVTGRLYYTGDNVFLGYASGKDDLSKADENKGTIYTGDLASFDEDGYFYITGREKRFLKIYGNRVNLDECEQLLKKEFSNFDLACCGKDDLMVIYAKLPIKDNDMIKFISEKTGLNMRAFSIRWVEEIPRNASGKIEYAKLLEE
jgi:acyl-CoA synthetase (AMP-forming)/AMP-acid ligase II